jgi:hypothetical protein
MGMPISGAKTIELTNLNFNGSMLLEFQELNRFRKFFAWNFCNPIKK